jgi:hypothetical protein
VVVVVVVIVVVNAQALGEIPFTFYPREVTSTALFNMLISDLPAQLHEIKNVKSALFSDDLVIWISLPKHQEHLFSKIMNEVTTCNT